MYLFLYGIKAAVIKFPMATINQVTSFNVKAVTQ